MLLHVLCISIALCLGGTASWAPPHSPTERCVKGFDGREVWEQ